MVTYYQMIRGVSKFNLRLEMVRYADRHGISKTARDYGTTRLTVRKWIKRYKEEGLEGFKDRSRAPHHIPHKTPKEIEDRVIDLRKNHPAWGPERLKMHYELPISTKAIARIIRQEGLVKKKKRKWKKQRDLREKKKALKALEFIEFDTKDLSDIEKYWPQMRRLRLPRYEHTARDVRTGATWFAYARTNDTTNAAIFVTLVLKQLESYGVDMKELIVQSDNGSEYIGNVTKKKGESAFVKVLKEFKVKQARIPPGAKTWQSDVEAFHKLVEDELYDIEEYKELEELKAKSYAYSLYFNFKRKTRYRGCKAPIEILEETKEKHNSKSKISPQVFNFPPVILDDFFEVFVDDRMKGGYLLGSSAIASQEKN